jgi:clan AA aspartic protease (TIGR02281 family)
MIEKITLKLPQWALENVILLNVRLNDRTLVRMMLDTGAKYTVITPNLAERLALELEDARRIPVATARRVELVPLAPLAQVDVYGLMLEHIEAVVIDLLPALGVEGLLGMSFLERCRLVLDVPKQVLELSLSQSSP